jgi:tetratricopeptide (TPR) repeat protein
MPIVQTLPPETQSPLLWVGRKLKGLASKRPSVAVQIYGEAGIGKTRAVTELLQTTPFASLSKRAVTSIPELIASLPKPKKVSSWLSSQLERLEDNAQSIPVLAAYLEQLAPFALHVEDVHECDEARVAIWQALILSLKNSKGVGLLLTSRVELVVTIESIQLEPLNLEASTALLEKEIGAVLPKEASAWIYARAAGNPLFTLEYFRHLARQGFLWNDLTRWQWREPTTNTMPMTVEALIERLLLEAVDAPETKQAFKACALLENITPQLFVTEAIWAEVAGLDRSLLLAAIQILESRGMFNVSGIAHPLYREVTVKTMLESELQTFATRAVDALEHGFLEHAAVFVELANIVPTRAIGIYEQAADKLIASLQKARFLTNAAQFKSGEARCTALFKAAKILETVDRTQTIAMLENIIGEFPGHTEARYLLASCYAVAGLPEKVEQFVQTIPARDQLGWVKREIELNHNLRRFNRVLELWDSQVELQTQTDSTLIFYVGFAFMMKTDYAKAIAMATPYLETELQPLPRARLLGLCGLSHMYAERFELAKEFYDSAVEVARETQIPGFIASTLHNRSMVLEYLSLSHEMLRDTEEATKLYAQSGEQRHYASSLTKFARTIQEFGEYERAERALQEAQAILLRSQSPDFLVTCQDTLALLYLDWQPPYGQTLALKFARLAVSTSKSLREDKQVSAKMTLARVLSWTGDHQAALEQIEACMSQNSYFEPDLRAAIHQVHGLVLEGNGRRVEAIQAIQTAIALGKSIEWDVYHQQTLIHLDRLLGDITGAQARLEWFEARGLQNGVNIVKRSFPELSLNPVVSPQTSIVHLEVLGTMQISQNGVTSTVKGQKRKELLAVLLEARVAGRTEVKTLELLDSLYPDRLEEEGLSALKQNVFKTRAVYSTNMIATTTNGYALGAVSSDAEEFLRLGNTKLWRGAFLDGLSASDEVRETLSQSCQNQAIKILESNPKEAARVMRLLLESDPYNLEILKLTCQALRNDNNHRTLQRLYTESRAKLLEVGEVIPETWQEFLL